VKCGGKTLTSGTLYLATVLCLLWQLFVMVVHSTDDYSATVSVSSADDELELWAFFAQHRQQRESFTFHTNNTRYSSTYTNGSLRKLRHHYGGNSPNTTSMSLTSMHVEVSTINLGLVQHSSYSMEMV